MRVDYLWPMLPPKVPQAEALSQEIALLRRQFPGELIQLNPNHRLPFPVPRLLFGWHQWPRLQRAASQPALYHLYNPDPFPYPILRALRRPVIYSLVGGMDEGRVPVAFLNRLAAVTVYDEQSLRRLQQAGVRRATLIRPGIDTSRFTHQPRALGEALHLLIASAPWTTEQFASKGVDALLAAAQQDRRLQLTFLWRGVLLDEMLARVQRLGLADQVTVHNGLQNVNAMLAGVHAGIVLAAHARIVKAYPHSLLDALAAGKPVLLSRTLPMADYVARTGCGVVVEALTPESILAATETLRAAYADYAAAARSCGQRDFGQTAMLRAYQELYAHVCEQAGLVAS